MALLGIWLDKKQPHRQSYDYKMVVRPAMLYGAETVAPTKQMAAELNWQS